MASTCPRGLKYGAFSAMLALFTTSAIALIPTVDSALSADSSTGTSVSVAQAAQPDCKDPKNRNLKQCKRWHWNGNKPPSQNQWFVPNYN